MRPIMTAALVFGAALAAHALDAIPDSPAVKEVPAVATTTAAPAAVAVAAPAVSLSSAAAVAVSSTPVPAPALQAPPAPVKLASCVAPIQDLVTFHEKEIVSLKQRIDRWDAKVKVTTKRRQDLAQDVQAKLKKADDLLKQDTKASRNEANRLKKEAVRINKDIATADRDLRDQRKDLADEIRDVSKETQQALRDAYGQAVEEIQKSQD